MPTSAKGTPKVRLDVTLVERGLAATREKARALIMAGRVHVDEHRVDKPGTRVPAGAAVEVKPGRRAFASRGGDKLSPVLDPLGIDPSDLRCLDVGASTGGFTDVLLQRGAAHVTAVDVGRGLLDDALRRDSRVTVLEGVNARHLLPEQVRPPYDLITVDLSFISLALVLDALLPLAPRGRLLALIKPQFEAGREAVGPRGVVRDPSTRAAAVRKICDALSERGRQVVGLRASPLPGPKGNREVFVLAAPGPPAAAETLERWIAVEVDRDAQ
jgi:23S rRNA (cytidine1920-2'-O)/16S rRNA (cytidine1409-2'-O)-methyltransferase